MSRGDVTRRFHSVKANNKHPERIILLNIFLARKNSDVHVRSAHGELTAGDATATPTFAWFGRSPFRRSPRARDYGPGVQSPPWPSPPPLTRSLLPSRPMDPRRSRRRLVRASPGLRASRGVSNVCCMAVNYKATTDILENVREPLRAAVRYGNLALLQPDLHTIPSSSSSTTTSSSLCFDFICTPICTLPHIIYICTASHSLTHIRHGHEWGSLYVIQVGTGEGGLKFLELVLSSMEMVTAREAGIGLRPGSGIRQTWKPWAVVSPYPFAGHPYGSQQPRTTLPPN
ncbi:hypothetical protein KQX54_005129 [Cotesia glomerata]|uniref:Uncharacterized protein n=1 Tax=Cotesia glomerata TaxID=32391 RepID=A0AAV7I0M5_COTGL|nr:hypothetical protein KQX54_005129 [Cotesia glomerata]